MNKRPLINLIPLLLLVGQVTLQAADLTVVVRGVNSTNGTLRVALFESAKGFPMDASLALTHQSIALQGFPEGQPITMVFRNLTEKPYAVSVLHDADSDGKLKTNFLGVPREGTGVSNNPRSLMGPPKFSAAIFKLNGDQQIAIAVSYFP